MPGEIKIRGNVLPLGTLIKPVQVIVDNGGKRVLIPTGNKRQIQEVPGDVPVQATLKRLGMG